MIDSLRGKVSAINDESLVLEVSGFGIQIYASKSLISNAVIGEELTCFAHLQLSDAGMAMFGFTTQREKELFTELLQVKTVGGKLAISVLRHNDLEDIVKAIISEDSGMISAPGLGSKRAERICFELKNKIAKKFADAEGFDAVYRKTSFDTAVLDALIGLGFSQSEASRAVALSKGTADPDAEWDEGSLLKASLALLQRR